MVGIVSRSEELTQICSVSVARSREDCRQYLLKIANAELDPQVRARVSPSDLVQQTFLVAEQILSNNSIAGSLPVMRWLRKILLNQLAHCHRDHIFSHRRSTKRESRGSQSRFAEPATNDRTPSSFISMSEQTSRLTEQIQRLPESYRTVLKLRYYEGLSFAVVGQRLGLTDNAARLLWSRAIQRLRSELMPDG